MLYSWDRAFNIFSIFSTSRNNGLCMKFGITTVTFGIAKIKEMTDKKNEYSVFNFE